MRLAITGGAGFLSYYICPLLAPRYTEILALDIAPFAKKEYPENARCLNMVVRNTTQLRDALSGIDHVIHVAAALPLCRPEDIGEVNVTGTRNVLEGALQNRVSRVIHISSTAVYGIWITPPNLPAPASAAAPRGSKGYWRFSKRCFKNIRGIIFP